MVAKRAAEGGEILRRLVALAPRGTEYAAALDLNHGTSVGGTISGSNHEVEVGPLVARMRRDHSYILLHTHPANASFSLSDVLAFVSTPRIGILAAIGRDSTWYVLGDRPQSRRAEEADVRLLYVQTLSRLTPVYAQRILAGELTAEAALIQVEHEVWTTIAGLIGVRYDRSR